MTSKSESVSKDNKVFAVADGMGGHPGGGFASRCLCDGLFHYYERKIQGQDHSCPTEIGRHLIETIFRMDRRIRLQGIKDRRLENMGTTLSCLAITETHSVIAHVGDSRIYRLRDCRLSCLTVDHTFTQDMIFEGEISPAEAPLHPLRNMLTRAVGTGEPLSLVDSRIDRLKSSDRFLLCTDGLYNALSGSNILDYLSRQSAAAEAAAKLVKQALRNGARDNVTAIVIDIRNKRCLQMDEK